MPFGKKQMPCILKYMACILKYVPCIFFACPEACFSAQLTLMLYATNIEFS